MSSEGSTCCLISSLNQAIQSAMHTYSCIHTAHHNTKHQSQAHSHHSRHHSPDAAIVHHIFLHYLLRCGHLYLSILLFGFAFICWLRCRGLLRRGVSGRNRTGRARGSTVIWLRHDADKQCSLMALGRQNAAAQCGLTSRAVCDRPPGDTGACWHKAHHFPLSAHHAMKSLRALKHHFEDLLAHFTHDTLVYHMTRQSYVSWASGAVVLVF